jgi:hypothetical protein
MKLKEFDWHCGECPIIEYCNSQNDTAPCQQPRLMDITVGDFINVINYDNKKMNDEDYDDLTRISNIALDKKRFKIKRIKKVLKGY